jgi:hypothetical protein
LNCHHPRALEPPPFEYIFVVGARCELGEREREREMSVVGGGSIEMKRKQRGIKSKRRKEGRKERTNEGHHPQFFMTGNMLYIYLPS